MKDKVVLDEQAETLQERHTSSGPGRRLGTVLFDGEGRSFIGAGSVEVVLKTERSLYEVVALRKRLGRFTISRASNVLPPAKEGLRGRCIRPFMGYLLVGITSRQYQAVCLTRKSR